MEQKNRFQDAINKLNFPRLENLPPPDTLYWVLVASGSNRGTQNYNYHSHTFFEVHFILEGEQVYGFQDCERTLQEGDYLIIPPLIRHSVLSNSGDFLKVTLPTST